MRAPLIDRDALRELFLLHYERTRDIDACFDVLAEFFELRHRASLVGEKRSDLGARSPVVMAVLERVAPLGGLRPEDILVRSKNRLVVRLRSIAMWLLHEDGRSLHWIGPMFGGDHVYASKAVRAAEKAMARDSVLRQRVLALMPEEERRAA